MNSRRLLVTENDLSWLRHVIADARLRRTHAPTDVEQLEVELTRRVTVAPKDVPCDVITINSQVGLVDLQTREPFTCTLVLPHDADIARHKISILAPIGLAMFGHRVGDTFEWLAPAGQQRLKVTMIMHQPESAGVYDLANA